jgi:hypothetical protein
VVRNSNSEENITLRSPDGNANDVALRSWMREGDDRYEAATYKAFIEARKILKAGGRITYYGNW